jgi:hypothetical protein
LHRVPRAIDVCQNLERDHASHAPAKVVYALESLHHIVSAEASQHRREYLKIVLQGRNVHACTNRLARARPITFAREVGHNGSAKVMERGGEPKKLQFKISLLTRRGR